MNRLHMIKCRCWGCLPPKRRHALAAAVVFWGLCAVLAAWAFMGGCGTAAVRRQGGGLLVELNAAAARAFAETTGHKCLSPDPALTICDGPVSVEDACHAVAHQGQARGFVVPGDAAASLRAWLLAYLVACAVDGSCEDNLYEREARALCGQAGGGL